METATSALKIVSGGQTGADRAALEWAIENDIEHGGWCPAGRRSEDGPIDDRYRLRETPESGYLVRTKRNVQESDATIIFSIAPRLMGGSLATKRFADELGKPCIHLSERGSIDPVVELSSFLKEHRARVLNIAGPRASGEPTVANFVKVVLTKALL